MRDLIAIFVVCGACAVAGVIITGASIALNNVVPETHPEIELLTCGQYSVTRMLNGDIHISIPAEEP